MKPVAEIIAEHLESSIPDMSVGDGIIIGPPRPYDRASTNRNGLEPLQIFVNTSGGLMDQRYIGTTNGIQYKNAKIIIRSGKNNTLNDGTSGNYQQGHKLAELVEMSIRSFTNEFVSDVKLMSPCFYEGKAEDDMHYWFINTRVTLCYKDYDIVYGFDGQSFDASSSLTSLYFQGDYSLNAVGQGVYLAIPKLMLRGGTPKLTLHVDGAEQDVSPVDSEVIDGSEAYAVFTYPGPYTGQIKISARY